MALKAFIPLAILLAVLVMPAMVSASSNWIIQTYDPLGETDHFNVNINMTVKLTVPTQMAQGLRSLYLVDGLNTSLIYKVIPLGLFPKANVTNVTVSVALKELSIDPQGTFMYIQVRFGGTIEDQKTVVIGVDVQGLLQKQQKDILTIVSQWFSERDARIVLLRNDVDALQKYLMLSFIVIAMLVGYITKPLWDKRKKEAEVTQETILRALVTEYLVSRKDLGDTVKRDQKE
jgi:hypothetical protein